MIGEKKYAEKSLGSAEDFRDSALLYAGLGWPVVPLHTIDHEGHCTCGKADCSSPAKHPKTRNGLKDATTDVEQIKKWWPKEAALPSNIGIVTGGRSGLVVIDVDGDEGFEALGEERVEDLKDAPCVRTGRGNHYYFKSDVPMKTKPGFVNKVDIKAEGGYVLVPPSLHANGRRYEWLTEPNGELPDVSSWVFEKPGEKKLVTKTADNIIPEGQRNDMLFRVACSLRAKDVSYDAALTVLRIENQKRCDPPLPDFEVGKLLDSAYRYEPAKDVFNCTDLGNAKRLFSLHGDKIRYCFAWKKWLIWDGKTWHIDNDGQILRLAKDTVKTIYREATAIQDDEQRRTIGRWAVSSESEHRLKAMISLAESETGIPITTEQLDANHYLLNCLNGTIDLRTGVLSPHEPQNYITKIIPVEYIPGATCPQWIKFLETIFNGNHDLIRYVQKAIGYSLTGDVSEQCLFLLHGTGCNGKSTLLACLAMLLCDYAQTADFETFLIRKGEAIRNDLARMMGKRFISAVETEADRRLSEVVVKQLTGGDTITARFLFSEHFEFQPTFKIWLAANHKPNIKGTDYAIWRRIRLIPFNTTIPEDKRDPKLLEKLKGELPGILAWAVQGCLEWQKNGLQTPDEVKTATNGYREEMDVIGAFLAECCILTPEVKVIASDLYETYKRWCDENGEFALNQRSFGMKLTERGLDRTQAGGRRWWKGIGVKST